MSSTCPSHELIRIIAEAFQSTALAKQQADHAEACAKTKPGGDGIRYAAYAQDYAAEAFAYAMEAAAHVDLFHKVPNSEKATHHAQVTAKANDCAEACTRTRQQAARAYKVEAWT